MSDIKEITILELNPLSCVECLYPLEDDPERVFVKILYSESCEPVYAIKCPNVITPEGKGCLNTRFLQTSETFNKKMQDMLSKLRTKRGSISNILTKEKLEALYLEQNKSLQDIAKEYDCTRQAVKSRMEKHGIERRSQSKARLLAIKEGKFEAFVHDDINEHFFSQWSPEMAWILGLLFTDGNVSGGRISISKWSNF